MTDTGKHVVPRIKPLTQWYIQIEGVEHGPMSSEDVKRAASRGKLGPEDFVRTEKGGHWHAARSVRGLQFAKPTEGVPERHSGTAEAVRVRSSQLVRPDLAAKPAKSSQAASLTSQTGFSHLALAVITLAVAGLAFVPFVTPASDSGTWSMSAPQLPLLLPFWRSMQRSYSQLDRHGDQEVTQIVLEGLFGRAVCLREGAGRLHAGNHRSVDFLPGRLLLLALVLQLAAIAYVRRADEPKALVTLLPLCALVLLAVSILNAIGLANLYRQLPTSGGGWVFEYLTLAWYLLVASGIAMASLAFRVFPDFDGEGMHD